MRSLMVCASVFATACLVLAGRPRHVSLLEEVTGAISRAEDNVARRRALIGALEAARLPYVLEAFHDSGSSSGINVVVTLPGTSSDTILLGAHYDRVSAGAGAVDNGTACASLIALLASLRRTPLDHATVRGVFFDLEERQLEGSRAYFARHRDGLPMSAVNLDIFAYGTVLFSTASNMDGPAASALVEAARDEGVAIRLVSTGEYPNSDHRSMIAAGIDTVGLALVDADEVDLLLNPSTARSAKIASIIHTAADTMDQVRFEQVDRILPVVERVIRRLEWR